MVNCMFNNLPIYLESTLTFLLCIGSVRVLIIVIEILLFLGYKIYGYTGRLATFRQFTFRRTRMLFFLNRDFVEIVNLLQFEATADHYDELFLLRRNLDLKKLSNAIRICQEKSIMIDLPVLLYFCLRNKNKNLINDIRALQDGDWLTLGIARSDRKSL